MIVGRPLETDSGLFPRSISRIPTGIQAHYKKLGIPYEWFADCSGDDLVVLGVGGQNQPRELSELTHAAELGLGLRISLQSGFDIGALAPVLAEVRTLILTKSTNVTGWHQLSLASKLERLVVDFPSERIDVAKIATLRSVLGIGANALYASENPYIEDLSLDIPAWPDEVEIAGPLKRLTLRSELSNKKLAGVLPPMAKPECLERFELASVASADLSTILPAKNLEELSVGPCARVLGVGALSEMRHLRSVNFYSVKAIPAWKKLGKLEVASLRADHNYSIPSDTASKWSSAHAGWSIDPKRASRDDKVRARFKFDENGLDRSTFAPFAIEDRDADDGMYYVTTPTYLSEIALSSSELLELFQDAIRRTSRKAIEDKEVILRNAGEFGVEADFVDLTTLEKVLAAVNSQLHLLGTTGSADS